jgi:hypothetical protein
MTITSSISSRNKHRLVVQQLLATVNRLVIVTMIIHQPLRVHRQRQVWATSRVWPFIWCRAGVGCPLCWPTFYPHRSSSDDVSTWWYDRTSAYYYWMNDSRNNWEQISIHCDFLFFSLRVEFPTFFSWYTLLIYV